MTNCPNLFPHIHLEETNSTNEYLACLCHRQQTDEFTVVQADYQTAGKGQRGNSWESERGKNLLFSFVLYPTSLEARKQFILSQAISLAVKETLDAYADGFSVKWPNDIYWQEKKIGGILIENDLAGKYISRCIIGIGLNVNQECFVSSAPNPVSLKQITGLEYDRQDILCRIMEKMKAYYEAIRRKENESIIHRYKQSLFRREGLHPYRDAEGEFTARIIDVEADGHLVLEDADGHIRKYVFKEVQYVI